MVSEKVVVVLLIVAIILSVISIVVTISTISMKLVPKPEINIIQGNTEDSSQGEVSIVILPPENPPGTLTETEK